MIAKPIVDGLETSLDGQVEVIRLDLLSDVGRAAAAHYGVRAIPCTLVLDGVGEVIMSSYGIPNAGVIREAALSILAEGE